MIEYKAKTKWAGLIWVHAKYINFAVNNKTDLVLYYNDVKKVIPFDMIRISIKKEKTVDDRFKKNVKHIHYGFLI